MWYADGQELLYKFYNKTISLLSKDAQVITAANSILLITFAAAFIMNRSPDYWMSIFLFFTLGFYQTALNLTPSSIASYACLWALRFAEEKKPVHYFITVGAAALFHNSVIAFIPVYFLLQITVTPGRFWGAIISSAIVCVVFFEQLIAVSAYVLPAKYTAYLQSESGLDKQLLVWFSHMILFVLCWIASGKNATKRNQTAFVLFFLETLFYMLGLRAAIFSRAAFLFSPYLIAAIPEMLTGPQRASDNGQVRAWQNIYLSQRGARAVVVIACVFLYIARVSVNNIGTTMPYSFFWEV